MADDRDDNQADRELRAKLERIEDPLEKINTLAEDAKARLAPTKEAVKEHDDRTNEAPKRAERLASSGIKNAIPAEDFDRLVRGSSAEIFPTYALSVAREWYRIFDKKEYARIKSYMVLYGLTSRGKTFAGGYVISQMGGLYVEAQDLVDVMSGGHWTAKRRELLMTSRFTMVDDLGTEEHGERAQRAIFSFANGRQGLRPALTLLTANLALRAFENGNPVPEKGLLTRYDERTIRRFEHNGKFVEAVGDDLRRKEF